MHKVAMKTQKRKMEAKPYLIAISGTSNKRMETERSFPFETLAKSNRLQTGQSSKSCSCPLLWYGYKFWEFNTFSYRVNYEDMCD